jgi:uncharacterized protein YlzI (FlbEa/FlbD family)
MWIDLTDLDGPQLRVNFDNVTHIEVRTIEGRGYALVHLTNGQTLAVKEDLSEVAQKMHDPVV